ncbi:hypothetical protein SHL15_8015 [Streptomyces hygroscopicus subsp. limoneus]|nr:hypothetical protein SHL15_8015 [Streptomyces hygroscopicus subsp. limoneus]
MYPGRPARFRAQAARLDYRGQATWGELTGCAMKILAARSLGQEPAPQDRRFLTHRLKASRREVWEGNVGAHTLAPLALHATDPDDPLLTDGTDALLKVRNPDGGLPFIPDHAHFLSAVAALAPARSALPSHHQLLLRIGDFLAAHQNPDGGWAFTNRVTQGDTESTGAVTSGSVWIAWLCGWARNSSRLRTTASGVPCSAAASSRPQDIQEAMALRICSCVCAAPRSDSNSSLGRR